MDSKPDNPFYLFGLALDGQGKAALLADSKGASAWHHVDYSKAGAEQWLREQGLQDVVVEAILRVDTRPRVVATGEGVVIFLRGINLNPGSDPDDMVSLRIWLEKDRLITVRQRRLMAVQEVRESLEKGVGPQSIADAVVRIIESMANRIAEYVDSIEERVEEIESRFAEQIDAYERAELSSLRRQAVTVRRFLAPQREALDTLSRLQNGVLANEQQQAIREQSDRIMRYVEDLDLIRERILVAQEEARNVIAEQQNARVYVLSVVAAVFLPITFVTGMFGMNVAGLPGLENPSSFNWVFIGMAIVTAGILALFKWRNWF